MQCVCVCVCVRHGGKRGGILQTYNYSYTILCLLQLTWIDYIVLIFVVGHLSVDHLFFFARRQQHQLNWSVYSLGVVFLLYMWHGDDIGLQENIHLGFNTTWSVLCRHVYVCTYVSFVCTLLWEDVFSTYIVHYVPYDRPSTLLYSCFFEKETNCVLCVLTTCSNLWIDFFSLLLLVLQLSCVSCSS